MTKGNERPQSPNFMSGTPRTFSLIFTRLPYLHHLEVCRKRVVHIISSRNFFVFPMSLDYGAIMTHVNNHRKLTLLLLVIGESDCLEEEYKVVRMTKDYFELGNGSSGGEKRKRTYFPKPIESIRDAEDQFTFLHEKVTHITFPTFVQGALVTLLWVTFYLPYAHRYIVPSQIEPFFPSSPVAGWILSILLVTHLLESILVMYKLSYVKVSSSTMIAWWILTMFYGLPITRKAIHLHKACRRSIKKSI